MALITNAAANDSNTVHRVRTTSGRFYITHCGKEVQISAARQPRGSNLPKCRKCWSYYKTNLGRPPVLEKAMEKHL